MDRPTGQRKWPFWRGGRYNEVKLRVNVWTVPRDKESGCSREVVVSKGSTELPSFELVSHLKAGR